ncbi:MAG: hypothetical protein P1T08_15105 [Acidimicrobiia bacterium]|nr:hypothetical protein [Acidimicrobiia bacterium]
MNPITPHATRGDRRAAVVRSLVERSRRLGLGLMAFLLVVVGLPLIDANADTPGLEISLTADPQGAVKTGDLITYQYSIYNGTGQTLVDLDLATDLPDVLTPTATQSPVIARALTLIASDNFESGTFDGTAGSHDWTSPWTESPEADGPTQGSIKATTTAAGDPVAELRGNGSQLSRTVDLTGFPVAYLTYRIKQLDLPEKATITVAVTNPETGVQVAIDQIEGAGSGFTDPGFETTTVDHAH